MRRDEHAAIARRRRENRLLGVKLELTELFEQLAALGLELRDTNKIDGARLRTVGAALCRLGDVADELAVEERRAALRKAG